MNTRADMDSDGDSLRLHPSTSGTTRDVTRSTAIAAILLAAVSVITLGFRILRAGYGADNDTFLMLGTWDLLAGGGPYAPSRFQGYPLAELSIGATAQIGGHWLAGLTSVLLGLVSIGCTYDLASRRTPSRVDAALIASILAVTPVFAIAATTSSDYIYGLAFFLAAWTLLERGVNPALIGVFLGLATASRISYFVLGLILLASHPQAGRPMSRLYGVAALSGVSVAAYLPALVLSDDPIGLFGADQPTDQGARGMLGRVLLKGASVWGLLGTALGIALVAVIAVMVSRGRLEPARHESQTPMLAMLGVIGALWVWLPVEPSYLLPGVGVLLVWISGHHPLVRVRVPLVALLVSLTVYGWVEVQLFTYVYSNEFGVDSCAATEAVDAVFDPHLERGQLLDYPSLVDRNAACNEAIRVMKSEDH